MSLLLMMWALPFEIEDRGRPGPGVDAPDRDWDLTHVHMDLTFEPDAERVHGAVTLSLSPLLPPSEVVVLDAIDFDVTRVTVDGEEASFRVDHERLEVDVPAREHELTVEYAATPRNGLHFRGSGPDTYPEVWTQGEGEDNRHWLPLPDYPNDRFTTSGRFVAPKDWKVLSNGVGSFDGEAWNYTMDQEMVSYLIMVAAAEYKVQSEDWKGMPVEQWLPPDATKQQGESVQGLLPPMLDFFSEKTGVPYPYPTYREVYVQRFLYTGMENTTSTVMARRVLLHEDQMQTRIDGTESVMAHELAHQWYGDLLTCRTWHELWLNEGFATFMASEWLRQERGEEYWAASVARRYDWSLTSGPVAGRWWSSPDGSHAQSANVYSKGSSVLEMLRVMLGEEAFWAGIQLYTQRHSDTLVETEDLRRAMEEVSGQHLRWFFDQWVHLGGTPTLDASWAFSDGELRVTLKRGEKPWVFPVEVEAGGQLRTVWVDDDKVVLVIPMDEPPPYVAVDPRGGLLAEITTKQSEAMWLAQAQSAPHPYARIRAIQALADFDGESMDWRLEVASDETQPLAIRRAVIQSITSTPDEAVHDALAKLLKDDHARIRQDATRALADQPGDQSAPLAAAYRSERTPDVKGSLLKAWARHDRYEALRDAESWLRLRRAGHSPNPVHGAALDVLQKHGDTAQLDVILRYVNVDMPYDVAHKAMWASTTIIARVPPGVERTRAQEKAARAIEPQLGSAHLRTRSTAISVLGHVGDAQTIRELQAFQKVAISNLEQRAENAIDAIRKRDDSVPTPDDGELEQRLLALEEQLAEQEERLNTLEERR